MRRAQFVLSSGSRVAERSGAALRSRTSLLLDSRSASYKQLADPQGSRCISIGSTSNFVAREWRPTVITYSAAWQPQHRYQSTNTSQPSVSVSPAEPPLPVSSKGKAKAKVELRPGPAKPSTAQSPPVPQQKAGAKAAPESVPKPHPTKPPPVEGATKKKEGGTVKEEKESLIEIAKKDVDDAAQHGILAPPPPDAGFARRLYHQAKELFKFYWAGMKMIPANRKEVLKIQERVKSGGAPLTWRERRFIATNKSDMFKLVPFVLTIVIIEEIIPLIVMYAPGMLPSTCVLPSQKARIDGKRHQRQREVYEIVRELPVMAEYSAEEVTVDTFSSAEMTILCKYMGLGYVGTNGLLRRRLWNHLRFIAEDDRLLLAEGKGARLKQQEIADCLWERGILADSLSPVEQRDRLRWWLDTVKAAPADVSPEDLRMRMVYKLLPRTN